MKRWVIQVPAILFITTILLLYQNCGGIGAAVQSFSKASTPLKDGDKNAPTGMAKLEVVQHPYSKTAYVGDTVTFQAMAKSDDNIPLAYQWKKNGEALRDETGSSLVLTGVEVSDTGLYSVEISTAADVGTTGLRNQMIESRTAPLVVSETTLAEVPPQKVRQSGSSFIEAGRPIVLNLDVFGKPQPSIQWYKDGVAIDGATGDSLVIEQSQAGDGGIYRAAISNQAGVRMSDPMLISVDQPQVAPLFIDKSADQSVGVGERAELQVAAAGLPEPSYQWLKDGSAIDGATRSSYVIDAAQLTDSAAYSVVVSNSLGNFLENIQLNVVSDLNVTTAPADQVVAAGQAAQFSVVVDGTVDSYQWSKDGVAITGATSSSHSIAAAQAADAGIYKVTITNASGSVDASATLTVITAPQIMTAPQDLTVTSGQMATFSVTASGMALSYQWYYEGAALSGQTNATLNLVGPLQADSGNYSVTVSNLAGSVSAGAVLTVNAPDGAVVYANNCASCHGALNVSAKKMRTALQIESAIASQPAMMGLSLNNDELQALEAALNIP